jgi:hypothetical protein
MAAAALAMPLWLRWVPHQPHARIVLWTLYLSSIAGLLFISATGLSTERYEVDFLPALILISCVLVAVNLRRPVVGALAAALILYGIAANLAVAVTGPFDEFVREQPKAYVRLARAFSPIQQFRPLLNPAVTAEALFEFPERASGEQPLVAAGRFGSRYLLSAEHLAGNRWRLVSAASRISGNTASVEVTVKPAQNRVLLEFTPQNRTMIVHWNGEEVLRHHLDYLVTAPAQVMVGIDRTETGWDKPNFTGRVAWRRPLVRTNP